MALIEGKCLGPLGRWVEVKTWSPNCTAPDPVTLHLGGLIYGAMAASYGWYMAAVLETWSPCSEDRFYICTPYPCPDPWCDFDFHQMTVDGLPTLGGFAFYYTGEARLAGVRVSPPTLGPHRYFAEKQAAKDGTPPETPEQKEEKRIRSQSRREHRGRSARRYETIGAIHLAPERERSPGGRPSRRRD